MTYAIFILYPALRKEQDVGNDIAVLLEADGDQALKAVK